MGQSYEHDQGGMDWKFRSIYLDAATPAAAGTQLLATAAELNRAADVSTRLVAGGSALTLTVAAHDGKTIALDTAAGTTITVPAATGSGARYRFVVTVTATSNAHSVASATADIWYGSIGTIDTDSSDATVFFAAEAADAFDKMSLNRSTTGLAAIGDWMELEDIGANKYAVMGVVRISGNAATPFAATA